MLFNYDAVDATGAKKVGSIDAINVDVAISSLQRRGLVLANIKAADENKGLFNINLTFFEHVSMKDVVILSRQLSSLFNAQISALRVFRLLSQEMDNRTMGNKL